MPSGFGLQNIKYWLLHDSVPKVHQVCEPNQQYTSASVVVPHLICAKNASAAVKPNQTSQSEKQLHELLSTVVWKTRFCSTISICADEICAMHIVYDAWFPPRFYNSNRQGIYGPNICVISPLKIATTVIVPHISTYDASCEAEVVKTFVFVRFNCNPMKESFCANISTKETNSSRDVAKIVRSSA